MLTPISPKPSLPDLWRRGSSQRSTKWRERRRYLFSQRGQSTWRSNEIPRVQCSYVPLKLRHRHDLQVYYWYHKNQGKRGTDRMFLLFPCWASGKLNAVKVLVNISKERRTLLVSRLAITKNHFRWNPLTGAGYAISSTDAGCMSAKIRFQWPSLTSELQILHWLGITKIDRMLSMSKWALLRRTLLAVGQWSSRKTGLTADPSSMKYDAIVDQGITIHERVPIPERLIPEDSRVEIDAKIYAGYFTNEKVPSMEELSQVHGRAWYVHFPVFSSSRLCQYLDTFRTENAHHTYRSLSSNLPSWS